MAKIVHARSRARIEQFRALLTEYHESPGCAACFRDFEGEAAWLPGEYSPPGGRLLLATWGRRLAGCVGVSKLEDGVCKMKRLYVRPEFRGKGVGRALAVAALDAARRLGYERMRLWTFPFMKEAIALYKGLGFRLVEVHKSHSGRRVLCMEIGLGPSPH
ncbi:MAG: GNAT family N-acetyltransferase, partial [Planctomycetes bacterium]|nr:GNAT family N-acetyltransferase [Planctomycetota bacterium]